MDGCTFKIPRKLEQKYMDICSKWQEITKINLEHVDYEKVVIHSVNSYVAFKKGYSEVKDQIQFSKPENSIEYNFATIVTDEHTKLREDYIKPKGMFLTNARLGKGLSNLIISKALTNYFGKSTPIEETIKDVQSIHDYISYQKVGNQFKVEWDGKPQQRINRFYVSKTAPYLYKWKTVSKIDKSTGKWTDVKSYSNLLKGYGVQLCNTITEHDEYNINFNYYISKTREIIDELEPKQLKLF